MEPSDCYGESGLFLRQSLLDSSNILVSLVSRSTIAITDVIFTFAAFDVMRSSLSKLGLTAKSVIIPAILLHVIYKQPELDYLSRVVLVKISLSDKPIPRKLLKAWLSTGSRCVLPCTVF